METLTTPIRTATPTYEAPVGKLVRTCALGIAIGFSVLVAAAILVLPNLVTTPIVWILWSSVTLTSLLVYTVGSVKFRNTSLGPSRRTQRWLNSSP